jgi:hypothetical protein
MPMKTSTYPQEQPKRISWFEKTRVTWRRVRYGKTVKPQRDQVSNLALADSQVMQSRDERISYARPLSTGHDGAGEDSGKW